jgi:hypothetical protein
LEINHIGVQGPQAFAEALKINITLITLNLGNNPMPGK